MKRVLIIGGYGNFGSFISKRLAREENIQVIIAGRSLEKAKAHAEKLGGKAEAAAVDTNNNFARSLESLKPDIVIHTSGPYQGQGYDVAKACIAYGCHYVDLADSREFVANISALDKSAKEKDVLICSGASSVPCLTSALVEHYKPKFKTLEKIEYAIATAQQTNNGLATTSAVLSYAGKPFTILTGGRIKTIYGWQDLQFRKFRDLGYRPLGNCDIPDLDLFPQLYPDLKTIRFKAGLELKFLHVGLWLMSWLVRAGIIRSLQEAAAPLLKISKIFDPFGTDDSGFYMSFSGKDENGVQKELLFEIVAKDGDGPYIPSIPSILMTKKLAAGQVTERGAKACIGFITLDEYLEALKELNIQAFSS